MLLLDILRIKAFRPVSPSAGEEGLKLEIRL